MKLELVFTKSKKKLPLGSWLIRLWTWKPYSHVARKLSISFLDKPVYFQSNETKVNWEYEDHFFKDHEVVRSYEVEISREQLGQLNKTCWEQVGVKYGFLQNLGIAYVDFMNLFGIKVKNPFTSGMNCSEVIYRNAIIPIYGDHGYNPNSIKPHQIEEIIKKYL